MGSSRGPGAALIAALTLAGACHASVFGPGDVLRGSWGGRGMGLEVDVDTASAVFDCGYGTLEAPIVLDAHGRFSTPGEYVREVGPRALRNPARFEGRVRGSYLEVSVFVTDTIAGTGPFIVGPFSGALGAQPQVYFCQ